MRRLLVAEKFSAALRLATVLSEGMVKRLRADGVSQFTFSRGPDEIRAIPLRGHFLNLDYPEELQRWDTTDLRLLIDADPVRKVTMPDVAAALQAAAVERDDVIVATDFDREGELIGAEAVEVIREVNPSADVRRARFSALTRPEIEASFSDLTTLDEHLAASARTREAIDLMWGAVLTRFLSLAIGLGPREVLSVGRVQTPTLAVIAAREREVEEFVPRPYWDVLADLTVRGADFEAALARGRLWQRDEAEAAQGLTELATQATVSTVSTSTRDERAPPPLHTTRFLGLADRAGISPAKAMATAESLYHDGLISYPRTDNTVYPPALGLRRLVENLRESDVSAEAEYVLGLERIRPTRGREATTDHPPIHPTAGARKARLRGWAWTAYELVARHFLATLSPPARVETAIGEIAIGEVAFRAEGRRTVDPGWRTVMPAREAAHVDLPPLAAGDDVAVRAVRIQTGRTSPPPRYFPGGLIQEMERLGLGTKSTRHEIVQKLYSREYVQARRMRLSARGRAVVDALETYAPRAASADLTRDLEARLDGIARGDVDPASVLREAREALRAVVADLEAHRDGLSRWIRDSIRTDRDFGACEACGEGRMVVRRGRGARRFLGCSRFPECRNARSLPTEEFIVRARPTEAVLPEASPPEA